MIRIFALVTPWMNVRGWGVRSQIINQASPVWPLGRRILFSAGEEDAEMTTAADFHPQLKVNCISGLPGLFLVSLFS
jgi:hypothetical protein